MAREIAHEVKSRALFGQRFTSWCGLTFTESRSAGWFTKSCPACKTAKRGGRK